ncbi:hypothetical protein [Pectobacterium actinidiae]|uniref:hypothetical protein n=1 Tax=Pectobacterium actinidiae TaxID=1507808 RepID=UPI003821B35B
MHDPFRITQPTCLSFSGGRSSAHMLWRGQQANTGPPAVTMVCFANTGKESLNQASKPRGARFRTDGPSDADLARFAASQGDLFDPIEASVGCYCGD